MFTFNPWFLYLTGSIDSPFIDLILLIFFSSSIFDFDLYTLYKDLDA